jgi:hypothetical protein
VDNAPGNVLQLKTNPPPVQLAHQYLGQLDDDEGTLDAVLGTVGTIVSYRLGPLDAETLDKQFALRPLMDTTLQELAPWCLQARLPDRTVELTTEDPPAPDYPAATRKIRNSSRAKYALPKTRVAETLAKLIENAA